MYFHLPRKAFAIKGRSYKHLRQFHRSSALDFNERTLINNIGHFLLLLFPFVDFLLQISDLLRDGVKPVTIAGPIGDRADECSVRIFKGLLAIVRRYQVKLLWTRLAVSSFLPAN
jgi:hypothetical protein